MPAPGPGMKPANRAALGRRIDYPASGDVLPPDFGWLIISAG
jgi:hypothetical protein